MGWELAEEVAWARPERPGPEWWTLMDIAQDARTATRRSMCGTEYLMARGKCSRATIYRRLKKLTDDKLIKVVRRSAPGVRAVYEISDSLTTGLMIVETRTDLTIAETCSESQVESTGLIPDANGSQNRAQRVSAFVIPTPSHTPSHTPSENLTPVVTTSVEGPVLAVGGGAPRQPIEREAWLAIQRRDEQCETATSTLPTSGMTTSAA